MAINKSITVVLIIIVSAVIYFSIPESEIRYNPGVLIEEQPEQILLKKPEPWTHEEFTITPMAEFHLKARVLSYENYYMGKESKLSPVDLALGWGPMSDQSNLDKIEIRQSNRWYYWKTKTIKTTQGIIVNNSANMHIIPDNESIDESISKIKRGSLVELRGYLVKVNSDEGWVWKSSLSRNDSGEGACEIFWVKDFSLINQ